MADLEWTGAIEPASLRRALRGALRQQAPELRLIAEDFFADCGRRFRVGLFEFSPEGITCTRWLACRRIRGMARCRAN